MNNDEKIIRSIQHIPIEQLLKLDYFKNRGERFVERAFIDDRTGRNELAFSDAIKDFNDGYGGANLSHIVGNDPAAIKAAFTTFQWLATNVGSSVLEEALKATGKKIVDIEE